MKLFKLLNLAALLALFVGCFLDDDKETVDDDHDHHHHGEEIVEDACAHATSGPFEDVTADDDAEEVYFGEGHTVFNVTLSQGTSGYMGKGHFDLDSAAEVALLTNATSLILTNEETGATVEMEAGESGDVSECTDFAKKYVFDLEAGGYVVTLGAESAAVKFFYAGPDGDHDHDHDDDDHDH